MSFIRFLFWRLFRRPRVGDVYVFNDGDLFDLTRHRVVAVGGNWARVETLMSDYPDYRPQRSVPFRNLIAFYRLCKD